MSAYGLRATSADAEWARTYATLYKFLASHPNSEDVVLLLSTCKNAYLTANAQFADIQELLSGVVTSPLRSGLELLEENQLNGPKINKRFKRALATTAQFDHKEKVWAYRHDLHNSLLELFKSFEADNELDSILIRDIVQGIDSSPHDARTAGQSQLLSFDLNDQSHLDQSFRELKRLRDLSEAIARFGMKYADSIVVLTESLAPTTADLFDDEVQETEGTVDLAADDSLPIVHWVQKIASLCKWHTTEVASGLRVQIEFKYPRPAGARTEGDFLIPNDTATSVFERSDAVSLLREALWFAHGIAVEAFKPNVSIRPMPDVYQIHLPAARISPTTSRIQSLQLKTRRCEGAQRPPVDGTVALAHLSLPLDTLNKNDFMFMSDDVKKKIEAEFYAAVRAAKEFSCKAIVFPEYSIPQSLRSSLMETAKHNNLTIIGGFEGNWNHNKLADEVFVAIPGESNLYTQLKQSPSLEEPRPEGVVRDGVLHFFANSPIGDFAVVVCSDFLEKATLDAWSLAGPLPDILFVVARNPHPELYKSFAVTDSFRLYCCVVICNICDVKDDDPTSEGTFVVVPHRERAVDKGHMHEVNGTFIKNISIHDIPFTSIRARQNGRPNEHGFYSAPRSAQRA